MILCRDMLRCYGLTGAEVPVKGIIKGFNTPASCRCASLVREAKNLSCRQSKVPHQGVQFVWA
jgi:hypothetical protein